MKDYKILTPIAQGKGKTPIPVGVIIPIPEDLAGDLLAVKAIVEVDPPEDGGAFGEGVFASEDQVIGAIVGVIPDLHPEDFTKNGTPKVQAVQILLNDDQGHISADMVGKAWDAYQKDNVDAGADKDKAEGDKTPSQT